ncbi:MAG: hypothetical protein KKB03_01495 [Nanoarchaeota archaeon]|nr:hypothetical protein [Nanoarchaeota archaeon]MBU1135248.1 hypothetical protein [Nanoarchaeota archaeon]MBU2519902.1 hypothetical protein [Nanoarchaeota archaeon]
MAFEQFAVILVVALAILALYVFTRPKPGKKGSSFSTAYKPKSLASKPKAIKAEKKTVKKKVVKRKR